MRLASRVQFAFLSLWIFSIPWSLAYHFNKAAGFVSGVLVDYRIPTISASAVFFLLFVASLFFFGKYHTDKLYAVAVRTLFITFVFQFFIGTLQFVFQHSVFGYLPFGEVRYAAPQIAKSILFTGTVYKLPYGTTIHPNVLAGFMVASCMLLLTQRKMYFNRWVRFTLLVATVLTCLFAQSITALTAFLLGLLTYALIQKKKTLVKQLRITIILIPFFSFIFFSLPTVEQRQNTSFSRRARLQEIAVKMIAAHPLTGVGWNNFTLYEEQYGYIPGTIRFLQPVHNTFLLFVSELGVIGWGVTALIVWEIWKIRASYLPFAALFVLISSLDHYIATLTTGRMLLILVIFCLYIERLPQTKEV